MTFIIVEDDIAVADSLEALLHAAGLETRVHRSGEDLIAAGPPRPGDTVVVDLGLPGISGGDVVDWLGRLDQPPRMVVISGKSSGSIARLTYRHPGLAVLRKPPVSDWFQVIAG